MAAVVATATGTVKQVTDAATESVARVVTIAFDTGDYATGGIALTKATLATAAELSSVDAVGVINHEAGYLYSYDLSNQKLLVYEAGADGAPLDEYADAAAMAASAACTMIVWGTP